MTNMYYHLAAADYPTAFPAALDAAPVLIQKRTYIDAWIINRLFDRIRTVQQYIIDNPDKFGV